MAKWRVPNLKETAATWFRWTITNQECEHNIFTVFLKKPEIQTFM